jgi:diguanylate cyclase (GGDEF)-like protein/PAS domain S-box-containing protein
LNQPIQSIRILHLEDDPLDANFVREKLEAEGLVCDILWVNSKQPFLSALESGSFDLVLSDFNLPDYDGMSALQKVRETHPELPVIVISGTIGEDEAVDCLKAGATDYVLKQRLQRLGAAVRRALREKEEYAARRYAEDEIARHHAFLRQVIDLDRNFIFAKNRQGEFKLVNRALAEAYGTTVDVLLGKTDGDFNTNKEEVANFRMQDIQVMDTLLERFIAEEKITESDGKTRWLQTVKRPIISEDGTANLVLGVSVDITERKKQEERLARLNRIHAMLSGINSTITRIRDRDALLHEACRIAVKEGGFKLAWCGFMDMGTQEMAPLISVGENQEVLDGLRATFNNDNPDAPFAVKKIDMTKPYVANIKGGTLYTSEKMRSHREKTLLQAGFQSFATLPLIIDERLVGAMVLYSSELDAFDAEEVTLLSELAGDISFALDYLEKQAALNYVALFDTLTNLPNRQLFLERSAQLIQSSRRANTRTAVVVIDIRRFGMINDSFGKTGGDQVLKLIAERLSADASVSCARIGDNTFAMALSNLNNDGDVAHALQQFVLAPLSQPFVFGKQELTIKARCGVSLFPADGSQIEDLVGNSEVALKKAKLSGEEYLFYTPDLNARVSEQLVLENQLRKAISDKQFVLYYQPKYAAASGKLVGFEALIRWMHPERGMVSPFEFIPLLEETGMILDVGVWVLQQAASDYRAWRKLGLNPPPIAVNVSAIQVRRADFVEAVLDAVAGPQNEQMAAIDLEITESVLMENIDRVIPSLQKLKDAGFCISIDDFGTGYSSFSYLAKIPLNSIKIDRSFISALTEHADQVTIVSTIILLAHALKLHVIAEGVETSEQRAQLQAMGCDELQGYLLGRPMPGEKLELLLREIKANTKS